MSALSVFPFTGTSRKRSSIWDGVPWTAAQRDPSYGHYVENDFGNIGADEFTVTALNSASAEGFAQLGTANGVRSLVATTAADHRGAQVQIPGFASFDPTDTNVVCVEFWVDLFQCSTFFVGLSAVTTSFFDASSVTPDDVDFIGFYRLDGGVVSFVTHNEESTDVVDSATVLAATYYHKVTAGESEPTRLAFKFNSSKVFGIQVDGVSYRTAADSISGLALPEAPLTPTLAAARGATQDETAVRLDIDWFGCFAG